MDYSRILQKPYLIGTYSWADSAAQYTRIQTVSLPSAALTNALAVIPFNSATLYRAKMCILAQVHGTPLHQGTLVVTVPPKGTPTGTFEPNFNNAMAAPHAFLSANQSTSVCVEVPFYVNSKLAFCDPTSNVISPYAFADYADIDLIVLNKLTAPTAGSTTLNVTIHVMFKDIEFYAPHIDVVYKNIPNSLVKLNNPHFGSLKSIATGFIDGFFSNIKKAGGDFLDWARGSIRAYTGLHNPNTPAIESRMISTDRNFMNIVDCKTQFERLDPYTQFDRIVQNPVFDTNVDEMDMKFLLSKPYYLGTIDIGTTTTPGTVLWSRPITPKQQILKAKYAVGQPDFYGTNVPLQKFHFLSRYWRGSIKIHLQASMTNFQFAKLTLARNYSPNVNMLTKYPQLASVTNLMTETFEFSSGGQILTFELPYLSPFDQLECAQDWAVNALQHGMYYIIANGPLITSGNVPLNAQINVFISAGDDFQYFGYATTNGLNYVTGNGDPFPGVINPTPSLALKAEEEVEEGTSGLVMPKLSIPHAAIPEQLSMQNTLTATGEQGKEQVNTLDFVPIYSVRDYIRRLNAGPPAFLPGSTLDGDEGVFYYPLNSLLGNVNVQAGELTALGVINQLYYGYTGGLKFKVKVIGSAHVSVSYVPPGQLYSSGALPTRFSATEPVADVSSFGNPDINLNFINRTGYINSLIRYPCPHIELQAHTQSTPQRYTTTRYSEAAETAADVSIIEGVIPNMSLLRFIGDISKWHNYSSLKYVPCTTDLGYLVVTILPAIERRGPDPDNLNILPVHVEPWSAVSDEGRFGFQVASPTMMYPQIIASGVGLQSAPYNTSIQSTSLSNYASRLSDPFVSAPAAYYDT